MPYFLLEGEPCSAVGPLLSSAQKPSNFRSNTCSSLEATPKRQTLRRKEIKINYLPMQMRSRCLEVEFCFWEEA